MKTLLISTYELGHQPLHLATAASALIAAGHETRCMDLAIGPWKKTDVEWAEIVGISVPMHTAMRLAEKVATRVRSTQPTLPIATFGLYAGIDHHPDQPTSIDASFAGAYEPNLVAWIDNFKTSDSPSSPSVDLERHATGLPVRKLLPPITEYTKLAVDGKEHPVGYVETTRGCVHTCRHCPVPIIYKGRIRIIDADVVLADIDQLVDQGAKHITFADPDFLNGVRHSIEIVRRLHSRHPQLTFDATIKVEHILEHVGLWNEFRDSGCLFVVSAFESVSENILDILDKGHTPADAVTAIHLLRRHGIEIRPSWMPFTPWTSPEDVRDILHFVREHDLIPNVDPVQYTIRLLVPHGSLLLNHPAMRPHLLDYDHQRLSYRWEPADPQSDLLQLQLANIVEHGLTAEASDLDTFGRLWDAVHQAAPLSPSHGTPEFSPSASAMARPRLTEPWFCCAEPTEDQFSPMDEIPA